MTRFSYRLLATAAAFVVASCATAGQLLPDMSTLSSRSAPVIQTSGPTSYNASSVDGKGLATAENRGDLDEFTISMPGVEADLNQLLAPIASSWPHPVPAAPRIKIALGNQYQAVTFPDGVIVIHLGALDSLVGDASTDAAVTAGYVQSDQELLYLLSHEFSHYALGHHNKTDFMGKIRGSMSTLASLNNAGATLSRVKYVKSSNGGTLQVSDQQGLQKDVDKAIGLFEQVDTLQKGGLSPAWNRGQEDEADALAFDLMQAANVKGPFYQDVFSKLKRQESLSTQLMGTLRSSVQQTQKQLLTPASLNAALSGQSQQVGATAMDDMINSFQIGAANAVTGYFGATHRDPEVRQKAMVAYESKAYPGADPFDISDPTSTVIAKVRALPEFKEAKIATIAYFDAVAAHANGDIAGAQAAMATAMKTRFKSQPAILYRAGIIAESAGRPTDAIAHYQAALKDPAANPATFRRLATLQIERGDNAGALGTIKRGEEHLGDADYFLPTRILMAVKQNKAEEIVSLTLKCRATNREDLVTACEAHRAGLDPEKLTAAQRTALEQKSARENNVIGNILGTLTPK